MNPDDSRRRTRPEDETVVIGADLREVEAGLRSALAADAGSIQPGDRLGAILAEARGSSSASVPARPSAQRWPILAAAAAVALVAAGTLWLAGRAGTPVPVPAGATRTTVTGPPTPSATTSLPSPSTTRAIGSATTESTATTSTTVPGQPASSLSGIPVYWIGMTGSAPRLFREFRTVPDTGGPIDSAITAMLTAQPLDPDYLTPWVRASRIDVTRLGDALTVDLSADAITDTHLGTELADRAVQELVYTATAAAQVAGTPVRTVTILVDGQPADAWGAVHLGEPTTRAPQVAVQSHVWVLAPEEGQELSPGPVTFRGYGTSFEANFLWRITRSDGSEVAAGHAMGGTGSGGFGEFAFKRTLPAGDYVIMMSTDDPSGGAEGRGPQVDTKSFTVR